MKNQMIREAWDTVSPTPDQRKRMREALEAHMDAYAAESPRKSAAQKVISLEEMDFTLPEVNYHLPMPAQKEVPAQKQKHQPRYSSRKPSRRKFHFSGFVAATAAVLALILVSSLFLARMNGRDPENPAYAAPTTAAPEPSEIILRPDILPVPDTAYKKVLQHYVDAINQNWSEKRYLEAGISPEIYKDNDLDALGWCLMDVDGNGREELLISDGEKIYDGYTISGSGDLQHFLHAADGDQYQLCLDGIFYSFSVVDGRTYWVYYKMEDGFALQPVKTVIYDSDESAYYAGVTETAVSPISKDEAGEIIVSAFERTAIPVTLFNAGENGLPREYLDLVDKYTKAIQEDWNAQRLSQEDMSILVQNVPTVDDLGYAWMDLDGDGFVELLITDGNVIFDLYTRFQFTDRQLTHVFSSYERSAYYLCSDGLMARIGSNSAATGEYSFLKLEAGAEKMVERLEDVYTLDENNQAAVTWTHYGPEDLTAGVTVSEAEASKIIDSYPHIFIPHITFGGKNRSTEYSADGELLARYAEKIPAALETYGKASEKTFCFCDVDGDGEEELLLGGENAIYRILQPRAGNEAIIDITAPVGESGYAYLCEGSVIQCTAMAQGNYHHQFMKLTDGGGSLEMETVDYIFYAPDTERWYEGGTGINTPITEEAAEELFAKYPQIALKWKPLSEFPAELGELSVSGTQLFEKVFMPVAAGEVSNRMEDVTGLIESIGFTWRMDEGIIECIDHDAAHGVLIGYLTNKNGYEEVFDLTYVNKYGENEEDCRKAKVVFLYGRDYYIGTDTIIYVGAGADTAQELRSFVFSDNDRLMVKVLATQFMEAYFSSDEIYMEQAVASDFGVLEMMQHKPPFKESVGQLQGLPSEDDWGGTPVTLSFPCIIPPDTDSYSYLTMSMVKENGFWKVESYGLEK